MRPTLTAYPLYGDSTQHLDLLSISPKVSDYCVYHSPFIAFEIAAKRWGVVQGNCHHWDCPRCGQLRARHEYGRIVEGIRALDLLTEIYFITITCRGREMSVTEALEGYLEWTNRLLDALRADAKKRGVMWSYVQVTEWQKRGHPHSHILTSYFPPDLTDGFKATYHRTGTGSIFAENTPCLRSEYLQKRVVSAGLGAQYDVSQVVTIEGASRYVAKYLFKSSMFEAEYPKNWRRVRYSQSFPKLPQSVSNGMALLTSENWRILARKAIEVSCFDEVARAEAEYQLKGADCILKTRKSEMSAVS